MQTCGQCAHGKLLKDNLQQRACKGAPPQLLVLPGPNGGVQMLPAFPNVSINDEACGAFKPRILAPLNLSLTLKENETIDAA